MLWSGFQGKKKTHNTHRRNGNYRWPIYNSCTEHPLQIHCWWRSANSFPKKRNTQFQEGQSSINQYFWIVSVLLEQAVEVLQCVSTTTGSKEEHCCPVWWTQLTQGRQREHKDAWFGWVWMGHVPLLLLHSSGDAHLESVQAFHTGHGFLLAHEMLPLPASAKNINKQTNQQSLRWKTHCL